MTRSPIIICGTGRSGTSVFTRLLSLHPNIWAFRWESQIFSGLPGLADVVLQSFSPDAVEQFLENLQGRIYCRTVRPGQPSEYDAGLFEFISKDELNALIQDFRHELRDAHNRQQRLDACARLADSIFNEGLWTSGKTRWAEKTPRNLLYADVIAEFFPDAKFIHVVRDGRDVASSMLEREVWPVARSSRYECTQAHGGELTLEKCAEYWRCLMTIGHHMQNHIGDDQWLTLSFENLAKDSETTFGEVLDFLNEPFHPAVLDHESNVIRRKPVGATDWADIAHIGRWRSDLSAEQIATFNAIAGEELDALAYPL